MEATRRHFAPGYSIAGLHAGHLSVACILQASCQGKVSINQPALLQTMSSYVHSLNGSSFAPSLGKLFGRTGHSPSDIVQVVASADGTLSSQDSPYHGDYASASQLWVFPDGQVVDDSGTVYRTSDLTYAGALVNTSCNRFLRQFAMIANNVMIFACGVVLK